MKRPELWRLGEWFLHQDNAPAHTALSVWQFLTKNGMTTASHLPLPGSGTLRFFPVSKNEEGPKRKAFSGCRGGEGKNNGGTEGFHFARVPELF